jgi:hypothetical protein
MGATDACLLTSTSVCILTLGSAMTRIKQALFQHGPCEASSAPLLSATAELPFCQADGAGRLRARHRRRMCSCKSKSKKQATHRVRKVRQDVGNLSVRVLFAVAVGMAVCANERGLQRTISDASHAKGGHSRAWYLCSQRWSAASAWLGMRDSPMSPTFARGEVEERCSRHGNAHRRGALSSNSSVGM